MRKAREVKDKGKVDFQNACFTLKKWHSNALELEADQSSAEDAEPMPTYAKQQLGAPRGNMSRILGLSWNKKRDTVSVEVPTEQARLTKRGILAKLVKIFPIPWHSSDQKQFVEGSIITPFAIQRLLGMRNYHMAKAWVKWESGLAQSFEVPRSLTVDQEEIEGIELHSFGDASANGVAACVYAVVCQAAGTNQGLIAARSRLSKQGLTIPPLELVAGHMDVNLIINMREALEGLPLNGMHCGLDSSVALHWIRGQGE